MCNSCKVSDNNGKRHPNCKEKEVKDNEKRDVEG